MVVKRGKKVVGKTVIQAKIVVSFNTGKKLLSYACTAVGNRDRQKCVFIISSFCCCRVLTKQNHLNKILAYRKHSVIDSNGKIKVKLITLQNHFIFHILKAVDAEPRVVC
jgi:hypothetical protein